MPQEYVPKEVRPTDYRDAHGNPGYNVIYTDGSYALHVAKYPPEAGKPEFGEIVDAPKKNGGTYKKFKRVRPDEFQTSPSPAPHAQPDWERRFQAVEQRLEKLEQGYQGTTPASKTPQNGSQGPTGASEEDDPTPFDEDYLDDIPF